jgi:hypothetical protein
MDRSPAQHCGWVRDSPVAVIHGACVMRRDFVTAPGPGWKSAYFRLINDKASKEHDIFALLLTSRALKPPIESRGADCASALSYAYSAPRVARADGKHPWAAKTKMRCSNPAYRRG